MDVVDVRDVAAAQKALERAARRVFPYDPQACTLYMDVAPRQLLYACMTCAPANSLCYACALRCHGSHTLVTLDSKREFRCDCGTERLNSPCQLRHTSGDEWPNSHLRYCDNFLGKFCICKEKTTDSSYGSGTMVQCLIGSRCGEDWFHARCIANVSWEEEQLREAADHTDMATEVNSETVEIGDENESEDDDDDEYVDESEKDTGTFALFPELPKMFGAVICPDCIQDVDQIKGSVVERASVNGFTFLRRDYWHFFHLSPELRPLITQFPFLGQIEKTYTPNLDTAPSSLLEAGEAALMNLPRDAVLDGLSKFKVMESELVTFLTTIANEGRAVTEEDVATFFNSRKP